MKNTEILIKNMVCPRCVTAVKEVLSKNNLGYESVELGHAILSESPSKTQLKDLSHSLNEIGFEVLHSKEEKIVEQIKTKLQVLVSQEEIPDAFSLSGFLQQELAEDYSNLSHVFSQTQALTIEKYFINLKLEKVKELLTYKELQLSEIAYRLGYASVQHLSAQFKKVIGMTPSAFKKLPDKPRIGLDAV